MSGLAALAVDALVLLLVRVLLVLGPLALFLAGGLLLLVLVVLPNWVAPWVARVCVACCLLLLLFLVPLCCAGSGVVLLLVVLVLLLLRW